MTKLIVNALEAIITGTFFLIVIVCVMVGYSYDEELGVVIGLFSGLFIGIVTTGTILTLISINSNLEEIKKNIKPRIEALPQKN